MNEVGSSDEDSAEMQGWKTDSFLSRQWKNLRKRSTLRQGPFRDPSLDLAQSRHCSSH